MDERYQEMDERLRGRIPDLILELFPDLIILAIEHPELATEDESIIQTLRQVQQDCESGKVVPLFINGTVCCGDVAITICSTQSASKPTLKLSIAGQELACPLDLRFALTLRLKEIIPPGVGFCGICGYHLSGLELEQWLRGVQAKDAKDTKEKEDPSRNDDGALSDTAWIIAYLLLRTEPHPQETIEEWAWQFRSEKHKNRVAHERKRMVEKHWLGSWDPASQSLDKFLWQACYGYKSKQKWLAKLHKARHTCGVYKPSKKWRAGSFLLKRLKGLQYGLILRCIPPVNNQRLLIRNAPVCCCDYCNKGGEIDFDNSCEGSRAGITPHPIIVKAKPRIFVEGERKWSRMFRCSNAKCKQLFFSQSSHHRGDQTRGLCPYCSTETAQKKPSDTDVWCKGSAGGRFPPPSSFDHRPNKASVTADTIELLKSVIRDCEDDYLPITEEAVVEFLFYLECHCSQDELKVFDRFQTDRGDETQSSRSRQWKVPKKLQRSLQQKALRALRLQEMRRRLRLKRDELRGETKDELRDEMIKVCDRALSGQPCPQSLELARKQLELLLDRTIPEDAFHTPKWKDTGESS